MGQERNYGPDSGSSGAVGGATDEYGDQVFLTSGNTDREEEAMGPVGQCSMIYLLVHAHAQLTDGSHDVTFWR